MLAMLEKLINEHGSSTILRERLELFSDKYSMLEEKNAHLTENNNNLETQVASLKEEVMKLQSIIDVNTEKQNDSDLSEITKQLLQHFFDQAQDINVRSICNHFSLEKGIAEYHLDKLKELGFVKHGALMVNQPLSYCISKEGRSYIVEN